MFIAFIRRARTCTGNWPKILSKEAFLKAVSNGEIGLVVPQGWTRQKALDLASKIPEWRIINLDETPLAFEPVPSRTLAPKGSKSVSLAVSRSGMERRALTVVLAVAASGKTLPCL